MLGRVDFFDLSIGQELLVLLPGHGGFVVGDLLHGDAVFDGAEQRAHVAADAGLLIDGKDVDVTLTGPGVVSSALQTGVGGASGQVRLTWTVNASGSYVASGTAGSSPISGSVSVQ